MTAAAAEGTAALVHLSGVRRGTTEQLAGETVRIGSAPDVEIVVPGGSGPTPAAHHGTLGRRGGTYELTVAEGQEIWVNGERVDHLVLASGDVLEVGRGGPVLRFRRYPPGQGPFKTLGEVFNDCWGCARYERGGLLKKAGIFFGAMPGELLHQTTRTFRLSVVSVLVVLAAATGLLLQRTVRVERTLSRQARAVEGLAGLLDRSRANPETEEQTRRMLDDLVARVSATAQRIESLEARGGAAARAIAGAAQSTVFLQGAYGFNDPQSGRPMRLVLGLGDRPVLGADGEPLVTTDGDGPIVNILYTGTGFVAAGRGVILTNRHVALPWEVDESAASVIEQGWRPVMRRFVGYLPRVGKGFGVRVVAVADSADLAVLQGNGVALTAKPLRLRSAAPAPGDEVLVMGYPLGIEAMVARAEAASLNELQHAANLNFWTVAERLANRGQITPLASRGIVGQVNRRAVVYDAETTHGGSGGPVLTPEGDVVAVNTAILPEYGGSNMGVPAAEAMVLLRKPRPAPATPGSPAARPSRPQP